MDRAMRLVFAAGLTLLLCGLAFAGYLVYLRKHPPVITQGTPGEQFVPPEWTIPAFKLVDQENRTTDRGAIEGHVSIVWFMYTHCPMICPMMNSQAAELQRKLKGTGVRFTAFSLDPSHDRPADLKAFGDKFDVDWSTFTLLTEPASADGTIPKTMQGREIYSRSLQRNVEDNPASKITLPGGAGGTMDEIVHGTEFFLVGPDGRVLGYFNSNKPDQMESLRERAIGAARALAEKGLVKP